MPTSRISEHGLAITANPEVFVTNEMVQQLRDEQIAKQRGMYEQELRRRDRKERRHHARSRQTTRQSILTQSDFPSPKILQRSPSPPRRRHRSPSPIVSPAYSRRSRTPRRASPRHGSPTSSLHRHRREHFDRYYEDELDYRLGQFKAEGGLEDFDLDRADKFQKEIEYFRKRLSLEERETEKNINTGIEVAADMLEGVFSALDVHRFETKKLSDKIEEAVEEGRFLPAVRHYINTGGGEWMRKNPFWSAATTFIGITLKNHLRRSRQKIVGKKKKKKKKRKPKKDIETIVTPTPVSWRLHDEDSPPIVARYDPSPRRRSPSPPRNNSTRLKRRQQFRVPVPIETPRPPAVVEEVEDPPTARRFPLSPINEEKPVQPPIPLQAPSEEKVVDRRTGKTRPRLGETATGTAVNKLMDSMQGFTPMLKHMKKSVDEQVDIEEQREQLGEAPKPEGLF